MSRRRLVALVVAPTLVLGLLVTIGVLAGTRAVQRDVDAADAAARDHGIEQDRFVAAARQAFAGVDVEADPRRVGAVAEDLLDALPRLGDAPPRGIEGSTEYRAAEQEVAEMRAAVTTLQEVAQEATKMRTFVLAANAALDIDPEAILPESAFVNGTPVRQRLVPPIRAALDELGAVPVPEGAGPVAAEVRAALTALLEEAETLASELDAGRGYRFEYGRALGLAAASVKGLAESVRGDLREAVDRIVGPAEEGGGAPGALGSLA